MYNIKDLMTRYSLTRQGVQYFVNKNLRIINSDCTEHAKQTSDGWQFDADAVRIIDELRGFSQVAILEQAESERVKELQSENENLRQLLLIAQSKLIKTQEDLTENQKLLSESDRKLLVAESQSKDSQAELKLEQALHNMTKQQVMDYKQKLDESNLQLEKIKNRGLIDRIFNNF
ncbi:MAG: hypothetical protein IK062_07235 [Selenomonadaceae bacterium]|nr:hypothetical protein [Selenomonadaceae bacterium]